MIGKAITRWRYALCLCLFAMGTGLHAQGLADSCQYTLSGQVLDAETGDPVPYATILVLKTDIGAVADENGRFALKGLCSLECDLATSCVGYKPATHHHDSYHGPPTIYMAEDASELESVVVEGQRVTGAMESISGASVGKKALSNVPTASLGEVLGTIQGVTFASVGANVQLPIIHGLYGNRVLIVNNGVKHGFQNWGTGHAPEININNADRITVLKGAACVRYGPEALAGAVVIESDPLELSQPLKGKVATGYQTNGRGYHAVADIGQGFGRFSYHLGGSITRIGDREAADYRLSNSGKKEHSYNAGLRYHLPQWDFTLYYSYVDQDLALLRSSVSESSITLVRALQSARPRFIGDFTYDIKEPNQRMKHHLAIAKAQWFSPFGEFTLRYGRQQNERREFDVRRDSGRPILDLSLRTDDTQLEWAHPAMGNLEGLLGVQYFTQNNDNNPGTGRTAFIPNYNTHRFSVFLIENLQQGKNTFELGLRYDHEQNDVRGRIPGNEIFRNNFTFENLTVSGGIVRQASDRLRWRSNIGSAWRTPNMFELYGFGQHEYRLVYGLWRHYFNEEGRLRTNQVFDEDSGNAEVERGLKWINEVDIASGKNKLTVTAYLNFVANYTYQAPAGLLGTPSGPNPGFLILQDDALFVGADITHKHPISKTLSGDIGASYLWSRNVEDDDNLINQPPANINYNLVWLPKSPWKFTKTRFSLGLAYTFRQFQAPRYVRPETILDGTADIGPGTPIFDLMEAPDGYFLAKAACDWEIGAIGGRIAVSNLFNAAYRDYLNELRYFADDLGRNVRFSVHYRF